MNFMVRNRSIINGANNKYNTNNNNNKYLYLNSNDTGSNSQPGSSDFLKKVARVQSFATVASIAGLFVFITVLATGLVAVFCCKKNSVFAFPPKSPQPSEADYEECELDDMLNEIDLDDTECLYPSAVDLRSEQDSADDRDSSSMENASTTAGSIAGGGNGGGSLSGSRATITPSLTSKRVTRADDEFGRVVRTRSLVDASGSSSTWRLRLFESLRRSRRRFKLPLSGCYSGYRRTSSRRHLGLRRSRTGSELTLHNHNEMMISSSVDDFTHHSRASLVGQQSDGSVLSNLQCHDSRAALLPHNDSQRGSNSVKLGTSDLNLHYGERSESRADLLRHMYHHIVDMATGDRLVDVTAGNCIVNVDGAAQDRLRRNGIRVDLNGAMDNQSSSVRARSSEALFIRNQDSKS